MVDSGFTRKKVESLTLGEKLRKFRTDHRMSLSDASQATKIQVKYLEALEAGSYVALPADVYVRGFLRSYARVLGCNEEAILRLYDRERHIQASLRKQPVNQNESSRIPWPDFVITPKAVFALLVVCVIGSAFMYLFREYRSFVSAPRLIIVEPRVQTVSQADIIVRGKTDRGARILINGQPVFVDTSGEFVEKLLLQPGVNDIVVSAANRFGKERIETIMLEAVFTPEQGVYDDETVTLPHEDGVRLSISAPTQEVTLTVTADGIVVWSGLLEIGQKKDIVAEREIVISSDNGQATYVEVGSEPIRSLSSEPQPVKDILFTPEP